MVNNENCWVFDDKTQPYNAKTAAERDKLLKMKTKETLYYEAARLDFNPSGRNREAALNSKMQLDKINSKARKKHDFQITWINGLFALGGVIIGALITVYYC